MSAKDKFHDLVKTVLENDAWVITDDPLYIQWGQVEMYIDLGAERVFGAERNGAKIGECKLVCVKGQNRI